MIRLKDNIYISEFNCVEDLSITWSHWKNSPIILSSKWFLEKESRTIKLMKKKKIPMFFGDVNFTGDDITRLKPELKGKEIGKIYDQMYMNALINIYNWKNRDKCLNHLMHLL